MRTLIFAAVLALGCSSADANEEPEWKFSRSDVESALAGNWTGSYTSGRTGTVSLTLALAPPAQSKCGSRTLSVKCVEITNSALTGSLTTSDKELEGARLTGDATVLGTTFSSASMNLTTADGLQFSGRYENGSISGQLQFPAGSAMFTLTRVK